MTDIKTPKLEIMKPGIATTEFWLTALALVCVTVLISLDKVTVNQIGELWPLLGSIGAYAVSRGIAKRG